MAVIRDVGRFRIVDAQDPTKFVYKNQQDERSGIYDTLRIRNSSALSARREKADEVRNPDKQGKELVSRHFNKNPARRFTLG
jgi:hypothetical protein